MKKYYITEISDTTDELIIAVAYTKLDAIKIANDRWDIMTAYDRRHNDIEIRLYTDSNMLDYDTIDWQSDI